MNNSKTFGTVTLIHGDCNTFMANCRDGEFDLAITDPPYGIGIDGQKLNNTNKNPKHNRKAHEFKGWDNSIPDKEYFEQLFRVSGNQIIWGVIILLNT
jgi:site-specific DNA-methyltransferase (adenine-specific)